ncbi:hypothetical protein [Klebsiella oxytoca]|uniref:hypothetical protein n=1 Tax=Klebsiella oxytoca TaxID=571 RepID=UPI003982ECB8
MTNSTITREQLIEKLKHRIAVTEKYPHLEEAQIDSQIFKIALAAMDGEPVAYTDERNLGYIYRGRETAYLWGKQNSEAGDIPLYRHAQQSVVPDKMSYQDGVLFVLNNDMSSIERGTVAMRAWNACRAAMLQSEPVTTANKLGNSPVIPDGYVMVPKVPTAEMQSAGASAIRIETTALNKLWTGNAVFRAMLAAAPQEVKGE